MNDKEKKQEKAKWEATRFELWILFLHVLAVSVLGLSLFPMIFLLVGVWKILAGHALWLKVLAFSFSISFGYFIFGTTLILLCVFTKNLFGFKIAPGLYTIHSKEALHWMGYKSM